MEFMNRVPFTRAKTGFRLTGALAAVLVLCAPVFAGPPFRTDDPEPVLFEHFEITPATMGTRTTDGWTGSLPAMEVNYGAVPGLQLHVAVSQGYTAPVGGRTGFAPGDFEIGGKYRFVSPDADDWFPRAAVYPQIEVPGGNQKLGFGTGHAAVFLPLWLQKDFGPWTTYGGGGYWINPGAGNRDYSFAGAALWRKISDPLNVGIEVFHQTSPADGVKQSSGFNVGTTYDFSENWHLLASVGTGIQNSAATNQLSYFLGLQLTF